MLMKGLGSLVAMASFTRPCRPPNVCTAAVTTRCGVSGGVVDEKHAHAADLERFLLRGVSGGDDAPMAFIEVGDRQRQGLNADDAAALLGLTVGSRRAAETE